ncbi:MAG: fatty acid--CoA ligase [Hyphomonadaceae bacterium]
MQRSVSAEEFDQMTTLGDVARHHGRTRGGRIALRFEGRETTFAEFDRNTNRVANALIAAGVKPGEAIAYLGKNSDHYFELVFGAAKAGAITVPIGWRLASPEASFIAENAGARLLFVGEECRDIAAAMENAPPLVDMVSQYQAWRDAADERDPAVAVDPHDTAVLLYTSGTTGKPKGVMLTSANILRSRQIAADALMDWNTWGPEEVSLVAMPAAHIGGTGWGIVGLLNGVTSVVAREFNPAQILDFIERDGVSKLFMVPAALQFVVRQPRAREVDYSRLRHILYGAAPIPVALLRECIEVFGCGFVQQYGLTETTGTIVYLPPEDHDPNGNTRMRAAGVPMPGVEIRIVDAAGDELGVNEIGEIVTRSAANMKGYWRADEATAKTMDGEGWLRTGDAGFLDEDGYLFIQDRLKDVIISGAENVYPAEVENAIAGHPHVADVAVIGVPDETWGEAVKAIVVPRPGLAPDSASIIAHARERIAHYKAPKSVDFVEALPRSASGKVLRRELREPYWKGRERRVN